jgi:hypothetical protein
MPKPRIDGDDYYPPIKKPTPKPTAPKPTAPTATAQPTTWEQQSYWERKAEQTRLEQQKYLEMMESSLMEQWAAANRRATLVSGTYGGTMSPLYGYNQQFQQTISASPYVRSILAAKPGSAVLEGLVRTGYSIPNYLQAVENLPRYQAKTPAYGGQRWTGTMEKYGPERPIQPYTGPGWQPAYLPDYTFPDFGFGGGGGSYDYTSNPFYRNAEATRKPTYYETYLTWRVK